MKTKELITNITGWSSDKYVLHMTDTAVDYLMHVLEFDQYGREQLICSSHFWKWWSNQWELRNERLIAELGLDQVDTQWYADYREVVTSAYVDAHQIGTLSIRPNRVILEMSFGEMVGHMFDSRNKKEEAA